MKKRVNVVFSGRVQGVGFRFTAQAIAASLGVLGWVKNLRNGGVEIVAEGDEPILKNFISSLKLQFSSYIISEEVNWQQPTAEFKDFSIRF